MLRKVVKVLEPGMKIRASFSFSPQTLIVLPSGEVRVSSPGLPKGAYLAWEESAFREMTPEEALNLASRIALLVDGEKEVAVWPSWREAVRDLCGREQMLLRVPTVLKRLLTQEAGARGLNRLATHALWRALKV